MADHAHELDVAGERDRCDPRDLVVRLEQPLERGRLLEDLGAEERARGGGLSRRHGSPLRRGRARSRGCRRAPRRRPGGRSRVGRDRQAEDAGGHERRRLDSALERDAELDEVPQGLDHRQRAAREDAVAPTGDAVVDGQVDAAERVVAVAEPGRRDRVGDEREPARGDVPQQPHDVGVEVDAVDDRLHDDVRADERGADDAGVAMSQRSHRVEDMRDGANAAIEGGMGLGRGRVRVPERDDDSPRLEDVDELERPRELGRERHDPHRPGVEEPLEQSQVGIAAIAGGMRAEPARGEERALEVRPEHARARAGRLERHRAQRGEEVRLARR